MSDLETIDDLYDTTCAPPKAPCHPHQARVRHQYTLNVRMHRASALKRQIQSQKHRTPAPITLAKVNLPD